MNSKNTNKKAATNVPDQKSQAWCHECAEKALNAEIHTNIQMRARAIILMKRLETIELLKNVESVIELELAEKP